MCRTTGPARAASLQLFKELCQGVAWRYDLCAASGMRRVCDLAGSAFIALPTLHCEGGIRSKRVSITKKMATVAAASSDSQVRDAQSLTASTKIVEAAAGTASTTCRNVKHSKSFAECELYQLYVSSLKTFSGVKFLGFNSDGGRISGIERQSTLFNSMERQRVSWAAPIASWLVFAWFVSSQLNLAIFRDLAVFGRPGRGRGSCSGGARQ